VAAFYEAVSKKSWTIFSPLLIVKAYIFREKMEMTKNKHISFRYHTVSTILKLQLTSK